MGDAGSRGFSAVESCLYTTLVDNPRSSAAELAERCALPRQVRVAVRDLTSAFLRADRHTHPTDLIEIVTGAQNIVSRRVFTLQDSAHTLIRRFDKLPYAMQSLANDRKHIRLREGVEYRALYDRESVARPGRLEDIRLSAFVVYPSSLLDALIALFDLEWERAVPLRTILQEPHSGVPEVDEQQRSQKK
jgi:hypothetical protein